MNGDAVEELIEIANQLKKERQIAAEMLECLEQCAERLHSYADAGESVTDDGYYQMARKIIRKAKGEDD
jgi:hypothetical protein